MHIIWIYVAIGSVMLSIAKHLVAHGEMLRSAQDDKPVLSMAAASWPTRAGLLNEDVGVIRRASSLPYIFLIFIQDVPKVRSRLPHPILYRPISLRTKRTEARAKATTATASTNSIFPRDSPCSSGVP